MDERQYYRLPSIKDREESTKFNIFIDKVKKLGLTNVSSKIKTGLPNKLISNNDLDLGND